MKAYLLGAVFCFVVASHAHAAMKTIEYKKGDGTYEGILVTPEKSMGPLPGILMVHNWLGVSDETKKQARRMADLGYAVFVMDVYGKGIRPSNPKDAGQLASKYKSDRKLFRERLILGLETLKSQAGVDRTKLIVVGYCFGGTGAIELARTGADVKGAVSFHGGLDSPNAADGKNIKARILALHGADDPFVSADELAAFEKEMRESRVDWELVKYGGAVHSFTDLGAGNDNSKGAAYNASADSRSFERFRWFAKDIFR